VGGAVRRGKGRSVVAAEYNRRVSG
jgi:hypothetical protein